MMERQGSSMDEHGRLHKAAMDGGKDAMISEGERGERGTKVEWIRVK